MVKLIARKTLVTIKIIYYRPDYRSVLQEFVWQAEDVVPELYRVHNFLNFWKESIEAAINKVEVAYIDGRGGWRNADHLIEG